MRRELQVRTHPETNEKNIVQGKTYRFSVLTESLLRLEYDAGGHFEDAPTQSVWNRDFPEASFRLVRKGEGLEIITSKAHLIYDGKEFSPNGLSVQAVGNYSEHHSVWHYGEEFEGLCGTARTLDEADGAIPLEQGIIARQGFSVMDDSSSLVLTEDGWVRPRAAGCIDIYFWAYGHDYLGALKDFYHLCGKSPMVPRYALGNWWSRYYQYTESSYKALIERFERENLPFSVAVIDMDWHLVDIDPKYGSGWTGFTWNRELFPDPEGFLEWLHERKLHVTLNVHPADGIQGHEEMYPEMAKALHVDAEKEEPVRFDAADPEFLEACFRYIYHPHENKGVDFWWLDWQSGSFSRIPGLDPLWVLNHYHYLDSGRDGKRPMTFSRYAGPGSHRYPVGFSGDTVITWESLDFQPYFTATASNIGYGMWSHDIGGHMLGVKDDELAGRWLQFGVFSPVMRLHSSNSEFNGKEPWLYKAEIRDMMGKFLRLRHRLIPYLYTMNHRAYAEDIPLVLPMYYHYPEHREAYQVPNQYEFGSSLLVAPVTKPRIRQLNVAKVKVWLPEGIYYDLFTGRRYRGGRMMSMYRGIESIPVLAKAGAIVPMTDDIRDAGKNPEQLCIHVFAGADGNFTIYEDDNISSDYESGKCAVADAHFSWGEDAEFVLEGMTGDISLVPEKRDYVIKFHGIQMCEARMEVDGRPFKARWSYDGRTHTLTGEADQVPVLAPVNIWLEQVQTADNDMEQDVFDFLNQAEIAFELKDALYEIIKTGGDRLMMVSQLQAMDLDAELMGALLEMITA